jgi:hypothetical protein
MSTAATRMGLYDKETIDVFTKGDDEFCMATKLT